MADEVVDRIRRVAGTYFSTGLAPGNDALW